jgi:hypothetical protein
LLELGEEAFDTRTLSVGALVVAALTIAITRRIGGEPSTTEAKRWLLKMLIR